MLESSQPAAALADTLRRAAAGSETRRVPDQLRAEDVDALYFSIRPNSGFRIVPEGLRNALTRPRITIEGRGRILASLNQPKVRIYFEVGLDTPSLVTFWLSSVVPFGLAFYNLFASSAGLVSPGLSSRESCSSAAIASSSSPPSCWTRAQTLRRWARIGTCDCFRASRP